MAKLACKGRRLMAAIGPLAVWGTGLVGCGFEGRVLADRLIKYSTRGGAYVEDVRLVIRQNQLARLDGENL